MASTFNRAKLILLSSFKLSGKMRENNRKDTLFLLCGFFTLDLREKLGKPFTIPLFRIKSSISYAVFLVRDAFLQIATKALNLLRACATVDLHTSHRSLHRADRRRITLSQFFRVLIAPEKDLFSEVVILTNKVY